MQIPSAVKAALPVVVGLWLYQFITAKFPAVNPTNVASK